MGCTPSHSELSNTVARSSLKAIHKHLSVLRIDPGDKRIPLPVKGSSFFNTDEIHQYGTQREDFMGEKEDKLSEQEKICNLQLLSKAHSNPQISSDDKKIERTAIDAEDAMSELIESQKHITETIEVRKQSSCESETTASIWDDKIESNTKQTVKKGKKQKNHKLTKQSRPSKSKDKSILAPCETEKKIDFPELLVKAHQSAYAYLNPSISKYETILHMASQATQTQLFLQQMVSFLVLHFDEINQLLEEIASDGENLLKDVGGNLAWPVEKGDLKEHPDLLQQLLQYTVNKMQLVSRILASVTSSALKETCRYMQSAATNLEEKLKAKQSFDGRLQRVVRLLEASAVGSSQFHSEDRTLCSEDSGIGVDSESLKEFSVSQHAGQARCDSCAQGHLSQKHTKTVEHVCDGTVLVDTVTSHDYALKRHFKDIFHSSMQSKAAASCQVGVPEGISTMSQYTTLSKNHSYDFFQSDSTQETEHLKICESTDFPSDYDEDDDQGSTQGEDDENTSLSERGKGAPLRRPLTSLSVTDNTQRQSSNRTENADTEEIILKMKDAISEKIKFVPAKCGHKEWIEDESGIAVLTARHSTATGSQKTCRKQQRSRSEESLRSQGEYPTLLELQRTQKKLSKKLEIFQEKDTDSNPEPRKSRTAPYLQDEQATSRSCSKLKAFLSKNFSILPNQDKVPLFMVDRTPTNHLDDKRSRKPLRATMPMQETPGGKQKEPAGAKMLSGSCCSSRQSVKKLIETFSPTEDLLKASPSRSLGQIKCIRKFELPVIPPTIPFQKGMAPINFKYRIAPVEETNPSNTKGGSSGFPNAFPPAPAEELSKATKEETDEHTENLPPPPEMLMDNSIDLSEPEETAQIEVNFSDDDKNPAKTKFHDTKRSHVSPKIKASLQSIDLLPSKNISDHSAITNKGLRNTGAGDKKLKRYSLELNPTNVHILSQEEILANQRKEAADLYKQTHKIIPLQNLSEASKSESSSSERKELSSPVTSAQQQKNNFSDLRGRNKNTSVFSRTVSPMRTPSSPNEKRFFSSPKHHRHSLQAFSNPQPSSPSMQKKPSPPSSPRMPSQSLQKKPLSPPPQRKPVSPPGGHKQSSPTLQKLLGSSAYSQEASPRAFLITPSPPTSPSHSYKGVRAGLDAGERYHLPKSKWGSNARSIFCQATSSLFEAKPSLVHKKPAAEESSQPEDSLFSPKSSPLFQQSVNHTRNLSPSAANLQLFVKRSFSDRRPGVQFHLPPPVTSGSEPALNQANLEESSRKAGNSWNNSPCIPKIKESNRSASHPELYVVGLGLHRD